MSQFVKHKGLSEPETNQDNYLTSLTTGQDSPTCINHVLFTNECNPALDL